MILPLRPRRRLRERTGWLLALGCGGAVLAAVVGALAVTVAAVGWGGLAVLVLAGAVLALRSRRRGRAPPHPLRDVAVASALGWWAARRR
ncbi:MAG TPA: hypothetical protein VMW49_06040 [Candidatus Dormibacteraeota bacterium]|nr:hypothetical protein [Candidatus Dormibacteraeota bacterium]